MASIRKTFYTLLLCLLYITLFPVFAFEGNSLSDIQSNNERLNGVKDFNEVSSDSGDEEVDDAVAMYEKKSSAYTRENNKVDIVKISHGYPKEDRTEEHATNDVRDDNVSSEQQHEYELFLDKNGISGKILRQTVKNSVGEEERVENQLTYLHKSEAINEGNVNRSETKGLSNANNITETDTLNGIQKDSNKEVSNHNVYNNTVQRYVSNDRATNAGLKGAINIENDSLVQSIIENNDRNYDSEENTPEKERSVKHVTKLRNVISKNQLSVRRNRTFSEGSDTSSVKSNAFSTRSNASPTRTNMTPGRSNATATSTIIPPTLANTFSVRLNASLLDINVSKIRTNAFSTEISTFPTHIYSSSTQTLTFPSQSSPLPTISNKFPARKYPFPIKTNTFSTRKNTYPGYLLRCPRGCYCNTLISGVRCVGKVNDRLNIQSNNDNNAKNNYNSKTAEKSHTMSAMEKSKMVAGGKNSDGNLKSTIKYNRTSSGTDDIEEDSNNTHEKLYKRLKNFALRINEKPSSIKKTLPLPFKIHMLDFENLTIPILSLKVFVQILTDDFENEYTTHEIFVNDNDTVVSKDPSNSRNLHHQKNPISHHNIAKSSEDSNLHPDWHTIFSDSLSTKTNGMKNNNLVSNLRATENSLFKITPIPKLQSDKVPIFVVHNANHKRRNISVYLSNERILFSKLDSIMSLTVRNCDVQRIPVGSLRYFPKLETLDLSNNFLKNLKAKALSRLDGLKKLNLSNNRLRNITNAFYNLESLVSLDLSKNHLKTVDSKMFLNLKNLANLNMADNDIKTLDIAAFQHLTSLRTLILRNNPLTGLVRLNFFGSKLQFLDMSHINLSKIPQVLTSSIKILKLSGNYLKTIQRGDLDSYPFLSELSIEKNGILNLEEDAIGRHEYLKKLFVGDNLLQNVPSSLPISLHELYIQRNKISTLKSTDFVGLGSLRQLFLFGNLLSSIEKGTFDDLTNLKTLSLRDNKIVSLESHVFMKLSRLSTLDLSSNPLETISPSVFYGLHRLQVLHVRGVQDKMTVSPEIYEPLGKLEILDAENSPPFWRALLNSVENFQLVSLRKVFVERCSDFSIAKLPHFQNIKIDSASPDCRSEGRNDVIGGGYSGDLSSSSNDPNLNFVPTKKPNFATQEAKLGFLKIAGHKLDSSEVEYSDSDEFGLENVKFYVGDSGSASPSNFFPEKPQLDSSEVYEPNYSANEENRNIATKSNRPANQINSRNDKNLEPLPVLTKQDIDSKELTFVEDVEANEDVENNIGSITMAGSDIISTNSNIARVNSIDEAGSMEDTANYDTDNKLVEVSENNYKTDTSGDIQNNGAHNKWADQVDIRDTKTDVTDNNNASEANDNKREGGGENKGARAPHPSDGIDTVPPVPVSPDGASSPSPAPTPDTPYHTGGYKLHKTALPYTDNTAANSPLPPASNATTPNTRESTGRNAATNDAVVYSAPLPRDSDSLIDTTDVPNGYGGPDYDVIDYDAELQGNMHVNDADKKDAVDYGKRMFSHHDFDNIGTTINSVKISEKDVATAQNVNLFATNEPPTDGVARDRLVFGDVSEITELQENVENYEQNPNTPVDYPASGMESEIRDSKQDSESELRGMTEILEIKQTTETLNESSLIIPNEDLDPIIVENSFNHSKSDDIKTATVTDITKNPAESITEGYTESFIKVDREAVEHKEAVTIIELETINLEASPEYATVGEVNTTLGNNSLEEKNPGKHVKNVENLNEKVPETESANEKTTNADWNTVVRTEESKGNHDQISGIKAATISENATLAFVPKLSPKDSKIFSGEKVTPSLQNVRVRRSDSYHEIDKESEEKDADMSAKYLELHKKYSQLREKVSQGSKTHANENVNYSHSNYSGNKTGDSNVSLAPPIDVEYKTGDNYLLSGDNNSISTINSSASLYDTHRSPIYTDDNNDNKLSPKKDDSRYNTYKTVSPRVTDDRPEIREEKSETYSEQNNDFSQKDIEFSEQRVGLPKISDKYLVTGKDYPLSEDKVFKTNHEVLNHGTKSAKHDIKIENIIPETTLTNNNSQNEEIVQKIPENFKGQPKKISRKNGDEIAKHFETPATEYPLNEYSEEKPDIEIIIQRTEDQLKKTTSIFDKIYSPTRTEENSPENRRKMAGLPIREREKEILNSKQKKVEAENDHLLNQTAPHQRLHENSNFPKQNHTRKFSDELHNTNLENEDYDISDNSKNNFHLSRDIYLFRGDSRHDINNILKMKEQELENESNILDFNHLFNLFNHGEALTIMVLIFSTLIILVLMGALIIFTIVKVKVGIRKAYGERLFDTESNPHQANSTSGDSPDRQRIGNRLAANNSNAFTSNSSRMNLQNGLKVNFNRKLPKGFLRGKLFRSKKTVEIRAALLDNVGLGEYEGLGRVPPPPPPPTLPPPPPPPANFRGYPFVYENNLFDLTAANPDAAETFGYCQTRNLGESAPFCDESALCCDEFSVGDRESSVCCDEYPTGQETSTCCDENSFCDGPSVFCDDFSSSGHNTSICCDDFSTNESTACCDEFNTGGLKYSAASEFNDLASRINSISDTTDLNGFGIKGKYNTAIDLNSLPFFGSLFDDLGQPNSANISGLQTHPDIYERLKGTNENFCTAFNSLDPAGRFVPDLSAVDHYSFANFPQVDQSEVYDNVPDIGSDRSRRGCR